MFVSRSFHLRSRTPRQTLAIASRVLREAIWPPPSEQRLNLRNRRAILSSARRANLILGAAGTTNVMGGAILALCWRTAGLMQVKEARATLSYLYG